MFSHKVFQIAFLISLLTHGIILSWDANLNIFPLPTHKKVQNLEISYIKERQRPLEQPKPAQLKNMSKKIAPPPFIDKKLESPLVKPAFIKPDIIAVKKKVTLPPMSTDKINNPSYISYYQIVREKIRRAAYQNYTHTETGEIYLSFTVSSNGYLKEVQLAEEKSSPTPYLKDIAKKSIQDASPFPPFPKELDYPQLSFNVVISFKIE